MHKENLLASSPVDIVGSDSIISGHFKELQYKFYYEKLSVYFCVYVCMCGENFKYGMKGVTKNLSLKGVRTMSTRLMMPSLIAQYILKLSFKICIEF